MEEEFGCSFHMANSSKKQQEQKGTLSVPNPKIPSNVLQRGVKEAVEKFYLEDDISRMMPGKNDCISITVNGNYSAGYVVRPFVYESKLVAFRITFNSWYSLTLLGKKQKVQKRMILSTLIQTYREFENRHESVKVSLSYFIKCRPKNCIFLGSSGTHFICVCTIHRNIKQMIHSTFLKIKFFIYIFAETTKSNSQVEHLINGQMGTSLIMNTALLKLLAILHNHNVL